MFPPCRSLRFSLALNQTRVHSWPDVHVGHKATFAALRDGTNAGLDTKCALFTGAELRFF